ncbi:MAG: hypothetical protein JXA82_16855 [Sedimentisphaerales bacterium]|nr:hypothetical protein [Sedimentisphaerales bacterium]
MKQEELEKQWKQQRPIVEVDPTFCESVMRHVRNASRRGMARQWRWEDWIGVRPTVQGALWVSASLVGLGRLLWMIHSILFQGVCYSC